MAVRGAGTDNSGLGPTVTHQSVSGSTGVPGHPAPADLRSAGTLAVLSKSGITDFYASSIAGEVGTSPITGAALLLAGTEITGKTFVVDVAGSSLCTVNDATTLGTAVAARPTTRLSRRRVC